MEEFDKYISQIFERFGYEFKCQILDGQFIYKHHVKDDYWIVSNGFWAIEHQDELFDVLDKEHKDEFPLAPKNTSLLLLIDTETGKVTDDNVDFVRIENDLLYFKKYVLPYTKAAFKCLQDKLKQMKADSVDEIIMSNEVFEDLKDNEEYAKLLYAIIHKLPFIPILAGETKEFEDELSFSLATAPLLKSLDSFPEKEEQYEPFVENLIKEYENEED